MRIRWNRRARDEVTAAAEFFNLQSEGLGERFLSQIDEAVREIAQSPNSWPVSHGGARRRSLVSMFSYHIYYSSLGGELLIIAVAHTSRAPFYWKKRLE